MSGIVFVNPPLTTEERYGVRFQSGGQTPPLGLANLAAMTRLYGYPTAIIDAAALHLSYEETVKQILAYKPDYIGLTAVTISIDNAARLADLLRTAVPGVPILIGGPHVTAAPRETLERYPAFDIAIIGEGDYTILELLSALKNKTSLHNICGLALRDSGKIILTQPRQRIKNLDALPLPAWDLLPPLAEFYCPPVHTLKRIPAALLIASRGCPGQCLFCDRSVFGNLTKTYSAAYTFKMIKELYERYHIREIQLRDDNFTASHKKILALCEIIRRNRLDIVWTCAGRVDMVNEEILRQMKAAGCWQIWYGIESGSQAILDKIKKGTTVEEIKQAVALTVKAGIDACGFFMLGNPGETPETMEATIALATELPFAEAHFSFTTPFPGSELYRRASEFGTFVNDWKKLHGWLPVFVPYGVTIDQLERANKKAFRRFYFRRRILLAYLGKIRSWRHLLVYAQGFLALVEWLCRSKKRKVA